MKRLLLLLFIFCAFKTVSFAQDKFLVAVSKASDVKVKVEWQNPYGDSVVQLNVQRSWDSVKEFRTVFVPLSPELPRNGFIDETAGYAGMYYRVFYVLADGSFFFTKAKKAVTGSDFTTPVAQQAVDTNLIVTIHDIDTVIAQLRYNDYKKFRDSIVSYTKDTLYSLTDADVLIRYYDNTHGVWTPSTHVFTNTDGYVQIVLNDATEKKYRLRFLDENHKPLFTIHLTQSQLLLDKTDFMHSGWFYFELYENDKIMEKNKFYIPKDF